MAEHHPQPVDTLITADYLITMDAQRRVLTPGAVAVRGDSIVAVGTPEELAAAYAPKERVDCGRAVILPGLVNTHGHAPMALLRGLADDLRLDVWLMGYMMPVEREFVTPHFSWLGTQLAAAEMIRCGTTTFMDMYYFEDAVADAAALAGLRAVCAASVLRFPTPDAGSYDEALQKTRDYIMRWREHPLVIPAIAPHAPYTVTPELMEAAVSLALEYDVPLHIHVAETAQEVEDHVREYGIPPVPWLERLGVLEAKVTAAHCVHLTPNDMELLLQHHVGVAHNPSSNLKLASGIAPVAKMLSMGLKVGIGTDGPASNNDLDMFEEVRLAALLAKGATSDPTALPASQALEMATLMGAAAMHIDHLTGSLEPGKRADLIVVRMDDVRHIPTFERDPEAIYSRLIYAAQAQDVLHTMVNGRWLMRDRRLLTIDEQALIAEADELARKIDSFLIQREQSVLSKLLAIGGVAQQKTFEVQVKVRVDDLDELYQRMRALPEITWIRGSTRRQYDTYFIFHDAEGSRLRYREDELYDPQTGEVTDVIYRLTLTTSTKEHEYENSVLLSRSRYDAPATRSRRFYREYFKPAEELVVHKERRRAHVRYGGTDFSLNFDEVKEPAGLGAYLEIKSRTWSRLDAERKAALIGELLHLLNVPPAAIVRSEYLELAQDSD